MKRFVLSCYPHGIYLGVSVSAQKMVWSSLGDEIRGLRKSGLVSNAVTWDDWDEVEKCFGAALPVGAMLVPVECKLREFATIGECAKAGLRMWNCFCPGEC